MKTFQYTIQDDLGIHARPAGLLNREAKNYKSEIIVIKEDKKADARKIFALMTLCAKKGDTITIEIKGEDEAEAIQTFQALVETHL